MTVSILKARALTLARLDEFSFQCPYDSVTQYPCFLICDQKMTRMLTLTSGEIDDGVVFTYREFNQRGDCIRCLLS